MSCLVNGEGAGSLVSVFFASEKSRFYKVSCDATWWLLYVPSSRGSALLTTEEAGTAGNKG